MTDKAVSRSRRRAVGDFTAFLGRSQDRAAAEDRRRHRLETRSSGASAAAMNAAVAAQEESGFRAAMVK